LSGDVDFAAGGDIEAALDCAVDLGAQTVMIDLSRVTFIDARGIGLIMKARRCGLARGVRVDVSGVEGQVAYMFDLVGLGHLVVTTVNADSRGGAVDGRR
jgi:anti-anti-sigma factor